MANMSYCRFQNTASDLQDCVDNMDYDISGRPHEEKARKRIIKLCVEVAQNYGHEVGMPCEIIEDEAA